MKISHQEEYGFRCIRQLALGERDQLLTCHDIAAKEGISVPYSAKLMNILKRAGLVTSVRGEKGGYRLSRDASEINLFQILEALGGSFYNEDFCTCFSGEREQCVHYDSSCSLRSVWSMLAEHIQGVLGATTLAELAGKKEAILGTVLRLRSGEQALRMSTSRGCGQLGK